MLSAGAPPNASGAAQADGAGGDLGTPGPFARGTLGRRLVIRVTALVALTALLITATTALATRQLLLRTVDAQLNAVIGRINGPGGSGRLDRLLGPGQPFNTVIVVYDGNGDVLQEGRLSDQGSTNGRFGRIVPLGDQVTEELHGIPIDGRPSGAVLGGLGHYRVVGFEVTFVDGSRGILVAGLPLNDVDKTIIQLLGLAGVLSLLAIVGTVFASRALVERSLRPLNRVAATAQQVSTLELDRGEVALAVRVPPEDTDPRSEVGRVGLAINHMLANVAGALEARQASESKVRQFVADASHELRNPLAAIRGYAELTRRSGEDLPPDAAYAIGRVEAEAERMSRLVEDLLLLARLDSGPAIEVGPTDLTEIALNAVSDARAAGPDHSWALSLPDEPVEALGDRHRLHQVVANLLANARTHTPPGTRVETGLAVVDGEAVLTVSDNGPGIPANVRDSVFERFTRADTSRVRAAGGERGTSTGLGLAIVAAVVEAHHGRVRVESAPGRTRFTVTLPLAPAATPSAAR
ncbi:MAG TPA: HAMP domain-containing sensor histidine kinase [Microlunatus sp.]|nr:HAMP domain-containing sensor histidine kinase [Microlunatus sp.]